MNAFDVRIHTIRPQEEQAPPFEVRWRVAGRDKSKSFLTRALADSYRAELVRAARQGLEFDPATGEPRWAVPEPAVTTWLEHAIAYADMKWPRLAPHSRASLADGLATVTLALTRPASRRPPARTLRAALYRHAFNPTRRATTTDPAVARALGWLARASLPVTQLSDPRVTRAALDALMLRLHGSRAAASTIARERAVFHDAAGYAVELGLLPANPVSQVRWTPPRAAAVNPQTVASPAQVRAILAEVARLRPELTAFFGCLYYAALRPEEAVALRSASLALPRHGRGKLILTGACPRTGSAWTSTGTPHEPRYLKHRPDGAIRVVPAPAALADLLRQHLRKYGTAPDGRLFRGAPGGILSECTYGRIWHAAREIALGPQLAATSQARRPYDLRHAALSLWLNATGAPAEVAARTDTSVHMLQDAYAHCTDGREDLISQQTEDALDPDSGTPARITMRDSKRLYAPLAPARRCPPYVRERPRAAPAWPTAFRPRIAVRPRRRLRR